MFLLLKKDYKLNIKKLENINNNILFLIILKFLIFFEL